MTSYCLTGTETGTGKDTDTGTEIDTGTETDIGTGQARTARPPRPARTRPAC
ncbi:hypothetical protein OK074_2986 [Actinobacteria bacterium OK074]|nr:hypothetical protein OK074_2986 [Actinobacteria bacterium OK074]